MSMQYGLRAFLFCTAVLFAQAPVTQQTAPAVPTTAAGLETTWDIAPSLVAMSDHATKLLGLLDRLEPNVWLEKGASPTYAEQLQSCKQQVKAVVDTTRALSRNPEQLAASLELLLRIQSLDTMLTSLQEVIRKYQDPARAQELATLRAEGGANRDRFQQYLVSLAADREHALQVMDKEAQRCRGLLATPCPAPARTGKKK
jgi:hypothetical protein